MAALQVASVVSSRASSTLSPSISRRTWPNHASLSLSLAPTRSARSLRPITPSQPLRSKPLTSVNIAQKPGEVTVDAPKKATEVLDELIIPSISAAERNSPASTSAEQREAHQIWMSDVVATQKRPYFLNREWTTKDIQYAVYMVFVHGLCLFAPFTFSWSAFGAFVAMYVITGMLGITLSYHRHLSHKSFVLPKWLEYVFAYCGVLAVQGPPLEWVSAHRFHHRHCDTENDPHTPYEGFWHSHMGWLLDDQATSKRVGVRSNIADMEKDPFYNWIEETYPWHVVASAVALFAIGGFPWLVWGFAVRAVWVYHITWAVNSASHVWGFQSWNTGDLSRNNWWVGILAFGEGWHNNHHAFEYSCRHGLEWWQYDPTWYTVKMLEIVGLAKKLRYPTQDHMARLSMSRTE